MQWKELLQETGRFLRALFVPRDPDPIRDLDEVFAPINVDAALVNLRIIEAATRRGHKELPEKNDTTLDGPQQHIQQYVVEAVTEAYRRANKELERLCDALSARDVRPLIERAERLPAEAERKVLEISREASRKVAEAKDQLTEQRGVIQRYRTRYGLERGPRLRDRGQRLRLTAIAISLAVLQAIANAFLFAQGMPHGLSGGLALAVIVGLADILWHGFAGTQAARVIAPDLRNRLIGGLMTAAVLLTVPFVNLGLVHLRNTVRRLGFAEGTEVWWSSLTSDPLGFSDFNSFALLALGSLCSILAVTTGWNWDEPIPELREAARRVEELTAELQYWEDQRISAGNTAREEAEAELEELTRAIAHNVQMAEALLSRLVRLTTNLATFVVDAQRAYKTLIQMYRDENRMARKTAPPSYFHEEPELPIPPPIEFDIDAIRSKVQQQKNLYTSFIDRSEELRQRIARAADRVLISSS